MVKQKQTPQGAEVAQGAQTFSFKEVLQDPIKAQQQIIAELAEQLNKPQGDLRFAESFFASFEVSEQDERDEIKNTLTTSNGVGLFPLGDISALTGLAKSGKSTFVAVLIASLLGCGKFGLQAQQTTAKVLYIDTEQHRRNVAKLRKRVLSLAEGADDKIKFVALRELTPRQRANSVSLAVAYFRPSVVVVDGIVDLINDFNNIEQSQDIVAYLSRVASSYDCHILNVLHTNKGADSVGLANMRGHLGAILGNKCAECWTVKKDGAVFTAKLTDSRNGGEGVTISYTIGDDGQITTADEVINRQRETKEAEKRAEKLAELKEIYQSDTSLTYNEIISRIMEVTGKTIDASKKHFTRDLKTLLNYAENQYTIIP
jgi:hypothetical protein